MFLFKKQSKNFLAEGTDSKLDLIRSAANLYIVLELINATLVEDLVKNMDEILKQTGKWQVAQVDPDADLLLRLIEKNFFKTLKYEMDVKSKHNGKEEFNKLTVNIVKQLIDDSKGTKERKVTKEQRHANRKSAIKSFQIASKEFEKIFDIAEKNASYDITADLADQYKELKKLLNTISENDINYKEISENGLKLKINKQGEFSFDAIKNFTVPATLVSAMTHSMQVLVPRVLEQKKRIEKKNQLFIQTLKGFSESTQEVLQLLPLIIKILEMYIEKKGSYPVKKIDLQKFIQLDAQLKTMLKEQHGENIEDTTKLGTLAYFAWIHVQTTVTNMEAYPPLSTSSTSTIDENNFMKHLSNAREKIEHVTNRGFAYLFLQTFIKYSLDATDENGNVILYSDPIELNNKLNAYMSSLCSDGKKIFTDEVVNVAREMFLLATKIAENSNKIDVKEDVLKEYSGVLEKYNDSTEKPEEEIEDANKQKLYL